MKNQRREVPDSRFQISECLVSGIWHLADNEFCRCMLLVIIVLLSFQAGTAHAAHGVLTYRYQHYLFELHTNRFSDWLGTQEVWTYHGRPMQPLAAWRTDGDLVPQLPTGVSQSVRPAWDREAIADTLSLYIARDLDREPGSVVITRSGTGALTFSGVGLLGRRLRLHDAVTLTIAALNEGVDDVILPVDEQQPAVSVLDPGLQDRGIVEVVAIGESDFSGSPRNREHNISVGLERFNGHVIRQGETFSFNTVLGPVNQETGYRPELVILGEKTLPEFGGGLCQVSTTAFRGAWEYGFPIVERRNHSFAVRYYSPQGTDATIYPPNTDLQFLNDGPSDLLMQTYVRDGHAYFIYYGMRDNRSVELVGPYNWGWAEPPPERIEYTPALQPGEKLKLGDAVPGLRTAWFRIVTRSQGGGEPEGFYSIYEARPLYYQVGQPEVAEPDWFSLPPINAVDTVSDE